jgi:hypothetical protein
MSPVREMRRGAWRRVPARLLTRGGGLNMMICLNCNHSDRAHPGGRCTACRCDDYQPTPVLPDRPSKSK